MQLKLNLVCLKNMYSSIYCSNRQKIIKLDFYGRARFDQADVVELIVSKSNGDVDRQGVYSRKMLDVATHYRQAGWKIDHDRPGYNESYEAFFVFDK